MTLKLGKVNRGPHLPALVASSISREIAQGRLKAGDQLPAEQVLATTFGVSRNVVREAIAKLRSEGRVWSQQGRGAFVTDSATTRVLSIDHEALNKGDSFASLFELRGVLEVQAAALAAMRRTKQDLAKMADALATMAAAPYGGVQWLKKDLEFHVAVAKATRNPYIIQFLIFISEQVRQSILVSGARRASDEIARATLAEHRAIFAALEASDALLAQSAMRAHLDNAAGRVGLTLGELGEATKISDRKRGSKPASAQAALR